MRRALPKVVLCVVLGTITTIAVAWWCAVQLAVGPNCLGMSKKGTVISISAWSGQGHDHRDWRLDRYDASGACAIWSRWFDRDYPAALMGYVPRRQPQSLIPIWARMLEPSGEPSSGQEHFRVADGRGWPFIAMWSCRVFDGPRWNSMLQTQLRGGVEWEKTQSLLSPSDPAQVRWDYFFGRMLPFKPAWPGLLADTVVYAAAWGTLLATAIPVRLVRGRLRCWRERCPDCGYPFGVSLVCTECGRVLPTRATRLQKSGRKTSCAPVRDAADKVSHAAAPSSATTPSARSGNDYLDQNAVVASSVRTQDG